MPEILFTCSLHAPPTPIGSHQVAVALSNPFGHDDVDFTCDKWVVNLRAMALLVHESNNVVQPPGLLKGSMQRLSGVYPMQLPKPGPGGDVDVDVDVDA